MRPRLGREFLVRRPDQELWVLVQGYQFFFCQDLVARVTDRQGEEVLGVAVGSSTNVVRRLSRFMHRASPQALQELWVTLFNICGCLGCRTFLGMVCHVTSACAVPGGRGEQDDNAGSSSPVPFAGSVLGTTRKRHPGRGIQAQSTGLSQRIEYNQLTQEGARPGRRPRITGPGSRHPTRA